MLALRVVGVLIGHGERIEKDRGPGYSHRDGISGDLVVAAHENEILDPGLRDERLFLVLAVLSHLR